MCFDRESNRDLLVHSSMLNQEPGQLGHATIYFSKALMGLAIGGRPSWCQLCRRGGSLGALPATDTPEEGPLVSPALSGFALPPCGSTGANVAHEHL
ncbi:hypothetical protein D623_10013035 [Myotis brandtii]|uniref:Uncharacterized protein n=1 Tax=Myotis brandtii TaxID=109478 RepID=S7NT43_MYOBR|nr:hypothetical protein D623_10013035 [Myotis brandtii]